MKIKLSFIIHAIQKSCLHNTFIFNGACFFPLNFIGCQWRLLEVENIRKLWLIHRIWKQISWISFFYTLTIMRSMTVKTMNCSTWRIIVLHRMWLTGPVAARYCSITSRERDKAAQPQIYCAVIISQIPITNIRLSTYSAYHRVICKITWSVLVFTGIRRRR